jgi:signal transduction histidine kinase
VTRVGETMYQLAGHRREMKLVWQKKPVASTMFKGADGLFYKSGYAPLEMNGEVVAMLGVDAGVRFFARLRAIRRNLTFLALFGLAAFAFGSVVFARRLLLPIRRLARSATRIGEGDYHTPIAEKTGDEIELLAETLNDMRARIVERDRYLQMMQRGIAHEVRNPLGGMELYCDILSDELAARPELLPHVDKIRHEIKTLDAVVNEFLDFTKDQVAEKKPVELREFLADLLMFYAGLAETQNVIIEKHLDQPNAAAVFDPDLLRRALHNLLLNAIQAMPDGGRLRVEVRCRAGVLEFVIADTGKGIPAAIRDSVFAPFFTTKEKGTGLGLPFARKIVESLGGELTLASDEGAGTQVTIRLPQPAAEEGQS